MEGLYKFYEDCGRMGYLEGIFVEDSEKINNLLGQSVYFGEVLGKHSEIIVDINSKNIELITTDPNVLRVVKDYDLESGYNPFNYVEEND